MISKLICIALIILSFIAHAKTFEEKSSKLNIKFSHQDNRAGKFQFTETTGSGLIWIDYNHDDLIDLLLINGNLGQHKLFENKGLSFIDVTNEVLPNTTNKALRGMGVCSADINQDGWVDFLITSVETDMLYINQQGKNFKAQPLDKTPINRWSTSCAFADLDNDGDLDLYVTRYVIYDFNGNKSCQNTNIKGYCNPKAYLGEPDSIYFNNGFGQFSENSKLSGIHTGNKDRGLGVLLSDFDQDQDIDIYVANDGSNNRLYLNNGQGVFKDNGLLSGAAINHNGQSEAGMGVALGDVNRDGLRDILVTHFSMETNTLYINEGNGYFSDKTQSFGLNRSSFIPMGWGVSFFDINNDGFEDMLVSNGHFHDFINDLDNRQQYNQRNHVLFNKKGKSFELQNHKVAFGHTINKSSRGLAIADWNNDGKIDFAVNNVNDKVSVYENTSSDSNNWIGIKLIGDKVNSSAIGSVVTVIVDGLKQSKEVISGGSFMSQSDLRLVFGLANNKGPINIIVNWPDGKISKLVLKQLNSWNTIRYSND
ncbi:MAG: CRTAC1 family protein [Marinicellaceae bacterium]